MDVLLAASSTYCSWHLPSRSHVSSEQVSGSSMDTGIAVSVEPYSVASQKVRAKASGQDAGNSAWQRRIIMMVHVTEDNFALHANYAGE